MGPGGQGSADWFDPDRLLRYMGHAVIVVDLEGTVRYMNPAAEELYGWPAAEAVGISIADVTVPLISQKQAAEIMRTLRAGGNWSGAFTVQRKDGSVFAALVTDTGIYDGDRLVGIVGVSLDLGLAMRPLLSRSSDAVLLLTRDDRVTLVSSTAARIFGWTEERALGATLWDLVHPDDVEAARSFYRDAVVGPDSATVHECRVIRFPEGWSWAEVAVESLLEDPAAGYVVCHLRDVTERRDDREQLVKLTGQLQTALTTRVVIEQAKGMVAQQHGISVDQAFELLRRHSRAHNARLHDVAAAVVGLGLQI